MVPVLGFVPERSVSVGEQRPEGSPPGGQIDGQRLPRDRPVDLVVLVDDDVAVRDSERPLDTVRCENAEFGQPVGGLAELHHQGVASLLEEVIGEVDVLATFDDLVDAFGPGLDV